MCLGWICLKRHISMSQNSRSCDEFATKKKNKREEWPASVAQLVRRAPRVRRLWCPHCRATCGPVLHVISPLSIITFPVTLLSNQAVEKAKRKTTMEKTPQHFICTTLTTVYPWAFMQSCDRKNLMASICNGKLVSQLGFYWIGQLSVLISKFQNNIL